MAYLPRFVLAYNCLAREYAARNPARFALHDVRAQTGKDSFAPKKHFVPHRLRIARRSLTVRGLWRVHIPFRCLPFPVLMRRDAIHRLLFFYTLRELN